MNMNMNMPVQWNEASIVRIYKKGDKTYCSNYREISPYQLHSKFYPISFFQG
jgi:hypothetical protein